MFPIKTILHPTDFSPPSQAAFHVACSLARDYGAQLVLLHVRHTSLMAFGEFGVVPPAPEETEEGLRDRLFQIQPAEKTMPIKRYLAEGEPAEEILRLARDCHADLIVMGTHGRTGLNRLIMGSVAELVVRRASCLVLTVKAVPETTTQSQTEPVAVGAHGVPEWEI